MKQTIYIPVKTEEELPDRRTIAKDKEYHGCSYLPLYSKWRAIIQRCTNPKHKCYHTYGGNGVRVCDEWLKSPKSFIDYCMTLDGWDNKSLTLDRINSYGNYEPGNVRFASANIQSRNARLRKDSSSGYTGVRLKRIKTDRFIAKICVDYKNIYIGTYDTAKEAAIARDQYIIDNEIEGFRLQVLNPS